MPRARCPYLGLDSDPQTCYAFPSDENLCYRLSEPQAIELQHQSGYCLTSAYTQCKIFQRAALQARQNAARPHTALDPEARRKAATWMMWLSALGLLVTVVAGLYLFDWTPVSAMLFGRRNPTATPPGGFVFFGSEGTQVLSGQPSATLTPLPPAPTETPVPPTPVPTETPPPSLTPTTVRYASPTPALFWTATFTPSPAPGTSTATPSLTPTAPPPSPSPAPSPSLTPTALPPSPTPTAPPPTPTVPSPTPTATATAAPSATPVPPSATPTAPAGTPTLIVTPVSTKAGP